MHIYKYLKLLMRLITICRADFLIVDKIFCLLLAEEILEWPIYEYNHTTVRGCVTGGYVYRGSLIPALDGVYVFADWVRG